MLRTRILPQAMALASPGTAKAFNWRQFAGTTIHSIIFNHPGTKAYIAPQLATFEKQTGINVRLEVMVDTQM